MDTACTLQIFVDATWQDAAVLDLTGEVDLGVAAATYLVYLPDYAIRYWKCNDAAALSVNVPVDLESYAQDRWPAFLADLLPQGLPYCSILRRCGSILTGLRGACAGRAMMAAHPYGAA